MKKVIEHGDTWKDFRFPKWTTCVDCGCKISFEQEDVVISIEFYHEYNTVVCPECGCICREYDAKAPWRSLEEDRSPYEI